MKNAGTAAELASTRASSGFIASRGNDIIIFEAAWANEWYMSVRGSRTSAGYRSKTKAGLEPFFTELKRSHKDRGYQIVELTNLE